LKTSFTSNKTFLPFIGQKSGQKNFSAQILDSPYSDPKTEGVYDDSPQREKDNFRPPYFMGLGLFFPLAIPTSFASGLRKVYPSVEEAKKKGWNNKECLQEKRKLK